MALFYLKKIKKYFSSSRKFLKFTSSKKYKIMKKSTVQIILGVGIILFFNGLIFAQIGSTPECVRRAYTLGDVSWVAFVLSACWAIGCAVGYSLYQELNSEK